MKKILLICLITFLFCFINTQSQVLFDDYFIQKTLRLDYIQAGNSKESNFYFEQLKIEQFWGGPKKNLIDRFDFGEYRILVYDSAFDILIYSRGYSTLFQEWQATDEAMSTDRSFYETVVMPFPKNKIKIELQKRNRDGIFEKKFELYVNPDDYMIKKEGFPKYKTKKLIDSGEPYEKVDIVIIPEGYTKDEMEKFRRDSKRFTDYFFDCSPFRENKDKFNIWIVEAESEESGTDIPGRNVWKKTIINSSFYTFGIERYLMSYDIKTIRDISSAVPYDQIMILVNSSDYGGGGVYNYYSITTSDDSYSDYVFCHEFGHGFGCLADEYWTSDVAVKDYINLNIEPYQPNITTLINFSSKWQDLVQRSIPIPTPSIKKYEDKVGAFEGGGYVAKGIYRPMQDCTMKSRTRDNFCIVCKRALQGMIDFYCEK